MDSLQFQGEINWTKFLVVVVIWLLIVFAVAGVVSGIDHLWTPLDDVLYQKDKSNNYVRDPATNNYVLKTPPFNRDDQCEKLNFTDDTHAGAVLEPENTWSNMFYLLAGMLILVCTKLPLGYLLGLQLCVLGVLSGAYHATLQETPQILDVAGIYFVLMALLFYVLRAVFLRRLSKAAERSLGVIGFIVSVGAGLFMAYHRTEFYGFFGSTTVTFTIVCALVVLVVYEMGRQGFSWGDAFKFWRLWAEPEPNPNGIRLDWNLRSYFWFFLVIAVPGIFFRLNDGTNALIDTFCSPGNPVQAHAIWHTFGAATLLIGYDLFAWSRGRERDYAVFPRKPPTGGLINEYTLLSTGGTALGAGLLLFGLSFKPPSFVDKNQPVATGITIASFFIVTGVTILILRLSHAVEDPTSDNKKNA